MIVVIFLVVIGTILSLTIAAVCQSWRDEQLPMLNLPEGMTADKLREITDYITESDNIIALLLDQHGARFERAGVDVTNEWSELVAGREMQEDLRRWANEIDVS